MASSTIRRRPEFAGILREENRYAVPDRDTAGERINGWFDTLMMQCGWGIHPSVVLMLCLCSGVAAGGLIFVLQENLLTTALGVALGFVAPIMIAVAMRARRQQQMMQQLPPMFEELARAARTGRSIDQCFHLVAIDTPAPLGTELRYAVRRTQMGMPLSEALRDLPDRTGLNTLNLFCMTISVHQQTGGDLVAVLERLSRTVRDRLQYLGRLRASTAASRATAILMILVPPGVLAFFTFRDPEYLQKLMDSPWGRNITLLAFALSAIGAVWVLRILKDSEQT